MSSNNPSVTASDIISDVEARLGSPNISATDYLPWISYAYQKTYAALASANQSVKEELFGNYITFTLTNGVAEYSLSSNIPRFGGVIKVEIKYGASGDDWVRASRMRSISYWDIQNNVSSTYRAKASALYYILEDNLGFIPTPDGGSVRVWYVRRPYQINAITDVLDIDYRFIYPIASYVQAKAIESQNEDYNTAMMIEEKFDRELEKVAEVAAGEFSESEGDSVEDSASSDFFSNPLNY